jgi:bifunctional non-homologous end joining protein LigD
MDFHREVLGRILARRLFEPKLDGFRALAYVDAGEYRLVSRKKHTYKSFQSLCSAIAEGLKVECDLGWRDGVRRAGRPRYLQPTALPSRQTIPLRLRHPLAVGQDLRKLPLVERKRRLRRLIPPQPFPVLYTEHEGGRGAELYQAACSLDLEGIVAKWKHGPYVGDDVATS